MCSPVNTYGKNPSAFLLHVQIWGFSWSRCTSRMSTWVFSMQIFGPSDSASWSSSSLLVTSAETQRLDCFSSIIFSSFDARGWMPADKRRNKWRRKRKWEKKEKTKSSPQHVCGAQWKHHQSLLWREITVNNLTFKTTYLVTRLFLNNWASASVPHTASCWQERSCHSWAWERVKVKEFYECFVPGL